MLLKKPIFLQEIYDIDITLHNHMEYMYTFINESGKSSNTKLHWAKTIDTALDENLKNHSMSFTVNCLH